MKIDLTAINFRNGLIPAVIQDFLNKDVLMLAYMNPESLAKSLKTGETHFWSRSRKRLWRKGETSGHIQKIKRMLIDCDEDTLLIEVEQVQVACHTGARSCFFRELNPDGGIVNFTDRIQGNDSTSNVRISEKKPVLNALSQVISERRRDPSEKSYTSHLLQGGIDRILKKVGEEATEFILSAKDGNQAEMIHEMADLLYHLLVGLGYYEIPFKLVENELARRTAQSGLEEKVSRKERGEGQS